MLNCHCQHLSPLCSPHRVGESNSSSSSGGGGGGEGGTGVEDGGRVACPVCNVEVPQRNINIHLDACLKSVNEEEIVVIEKQGPKRKSLPKLVYSLLNDKQIKQKLRESGLSTQGDRSTLITRHKRYTTLYNAECDVAEPRLPSELARQVERDERDVTRASTTSQSIFTYDRKTAPEMIEKEQKSYLKKNNDHFSKLIADIKKRQAGKKAKKEDNEVDESAAAERKIGKVTKEGRHIKKTTGKEINADDSESKEREITRGDGNISKLTENENEEEEIIKQKNKGKSINHIIEEDSDDNMYRGESKEKGRAGGSSKSKPKILEFGDQGTAKHQDLNTLRGPQKSKNGTVASFSKQPGSLATESEESLEETESSPVKLLKLCLDHQNIGEKRSKDDAKNNKKKEKMGDTNSGQDNSITGDYNYIRAMKHSHKKIMHNPEEIGSTESTAVNNQRDNTNKSSEMQSLNHCTNTLMLTASHTDDKLKSDSEVDPSPDLFPSSPPMSETSNASFSLLADTQPLSPPCLPADLGELDSEGEELIPARQPDLSHSVFPDEGEDECPSSPTKPPPGSIIHCNLENTEILTLSPRDSDQELERPRNELESLKNNLDTKDKLESQAEAEGCSESSHQSRFHVSGKNDRNTKTTNHGGDLDGQNSTVAPISSMKGGKEHANMKSESQLSLVVNSQLVPSPPVGTRRMINVTEEPCLVSSMLSEPRASKAMPVPPVHEEAFFSETFPTQSQSTKGKKSQRSVARINDLGADTQLVIGDTPLDPDYTPSQDMDAGLEPFPSVPTTRRSTRKRKASPKEGTFSATRGRRRKK